MVELCQACRAGKPVAISEGEKREGGQFLVHRGRGQEASSVYRCENGPASTKERWSSQIKPERYEAIRAMIKAGLSSDEICARIVGHYTERAKKEGGGMVYRPATYREIEEALNNAPKQTAEEKAAFEREALEALRVITAPNPQAEKKAKPDKP